jgi:hypothetical protein
LVAKISNALPFVWPLNGIALPAELPEHAERNHETFICPFCHPA